MLRRHNGSDAMQTCLPTIVRMNREGAALFNKQEMELGFLRMKNRELEIENKRLKKMITEGK